MQEVAEVQTFQLRKRTITMICPFCSSSTPAVWNAFTTNQDELGRGLSQFQSLPTCQLPTKPDSPPAPIQLQVRVEWSRCQNEQCREYIVQVIRTVSQPAGKMPPQTETWFAVPKHKAPPAIDLTLVPVPMREDYLQAYIIVDDAPRMSAVLSRRILSDLLKKYDNANNFGTAARIDKFSNNPQHPSRLRDNLHYLREIADFGAHTQVAKPTAVTDAIPEDVCWEDVIINASKEEAEWTLKVVGDLFDYFIIAPAKDKLLREEFDKKLEATGRKRLRNATSTDVTKQS
jgi:hypothetical protein